MSYRVTFNFKKIVIFSFAVLGFCLISEVSFAQEDMSKVEADMIKPVDKANSDNINPVNESTTTSPLVNRSTSPTHKISPAKKESGLVGEGKKPETAPSTLNFNIFLYIVDKFKADQK